MFNPTPRRSEILEHAFFSERHIGGYSAIARTQQHEAAKLVDREIKAAGDEERRQINLTLCRTRTCLWVRTYKMNNADVCV